jgi:hypothetical protein
MSRQFSLYKEVGNQSHLFEKMQLLAVHFLPISEAILQITKAQAQEAPSLCTIVKITRISSFRV